MKSSQCFLVFVASVVYICCGQIVSVVQGKMHVVVAIANMLFANYPLMIKSGVLVVARSKFVQILKFVGRCVEFNDLSFN